MKYSDYYNFLLTENIVDKQIVKVPKEAGTVPIPNNHLRLYHYTSHPEEIKRDGILISKAKGREWSAEDNLIWASTYIMRPESPFIEFSVPIDDPRFCSPLKPDITKGVNYYQHDDTHVTFNKDITPNDFIGVHEPWHYAYRYIVDENPEMIPDVLAGKYDYLLDKSFADREADAIKAIKVNYGE